MVILTAESLNKHYGVDVLFEDVSFGIAEGEKIGIIGANGAGKSTLLKILTQQIQPDSGKISINRQARIEILQQEPDLDDELGALDQALTDGPPELEILKDYMHAIKRMTLNPESMEIMDQVAELQSEMDRVNAWHIETEARIILDKLGIPDPEKKIGTMSGGQRKRVALARALIRPSDLLILDEPTNHLDVQTIAWLEDHLAQRRGALLMVTHDRYILESVTNVMFELADQTLYRHEANYSEFLEARQSREAHLAKQEHRRTQLAKKELDWLRRSPKARTTKSRSRVERAEALQHSLIDAPKAKMEVDVLSKRLGKKILEMRHISKSYDNTPIIEDFSYTFTKGERVGVVGPNGAGKSTLLHMMTGNIQPDEGTIERGETVVFGYYDQNAMELDPTARVHDYIAKTHNAIETSEGALSASQMLERFLFSKTKQWSPIAKLSGGERRRLYLLKVLMDQPNFLILDEPTNDLDVETLSVLEDYLDQFQGVLVVVSHDRYFLDRTVEHLLVCQPGEPLVEYPGKFSHWFEAFQAKQNAPKEVVAQKAPAPEPAKPSNKKKLSYKEQKELDGMADHIAALEASIEQIDAQMVEMVSNYEKLAELTTERQALEAQLDASLERWMILDET